MSAPYDQALYAPQLFDGTALLTDASLLIKGETIVDIQRGAVPGAQSLPAGTVLTAGFIDAQVNGGGGVFFNGAPTPAALHAMAQAHRAFGTTSFLPTLISDTRDTVRAAIAAVRAAMPQNLAVRGLHVEGPFFNPARKGIHPASHLSRPQDGDVALLSSLGTGVTLLTLAPEIAPPGFIRALVEKGVRVSLGHSDATADIVHAALNEGACAFTHLFNAMSQLQGRAPGMVGAALASTAYASVIADGHHVAAEALRAAFNALGPRRLFLISDAMAPLGTTAAHFELFGRRIGVADGKLTAEDGTLAGAQIGMSDAVRHMVNVVGVPLTDGLAMASATPADVLGVSSQLGRLQPGLRADIVALDSSLRVTQIWLAGRAA